MNHPTSIILLEETLDFDSALNQLDMDTLRRGYSELFDRAAIGVQRAGHDLDEIEMQRYAICKITAGPELRISVNLVSDRACFVDEILQKTGDHLPDLSLQTTSIHVIGLSVEVALYKSP